MKVVTAQASIDKVARFNWSVHRRNILLIVLAASLLASILTYEIVTKYSPNGITNAIWKIATKDYGHLVYGPEVRLRDALIKVPKRLARDPEIRKLFIDIGFKQLQALNAKRNEAIKAGILIQRSGDFVPASIRVGERTVKVKLRLKGDWIDHLEQDKWSFRIRTKGKDQLFGMRRFSIQHPATRGYQGEIIFRETLRQFGVLTPEYFFVEVAINGDDIGIMALEEHFSKELLERNGRKDGVIVRFDESFLWEERLGRGGRGHRNDAFNNYLNAPIDVFQSSKVSKSERLSRENAIAVGLLRGFVEGSLTASEVFDVEQLGSYLGVSEFWGARHDAIWHNMRFYLNPLTIRLEPIAFDANLEGRRPVGATMTDMAIVDRMLNDPKINSAFISTLKDLVAEVKSGKLIEHLQQAEKTHLDVLQKEYVLLEPFDYNELRQRANNVPDRNAIDIDPEVDPESYPVYVNAYLVQNGKEHYLEISNALPYSVEVQSIDWIDKAGNTVPFVPLTTLEFPISLDETVLHTMPVAVRIDYQPLVSRTKHDLEIRANIKGYKVSRTTKAKQSFPTLGRNPMPQTSIKELMEHHPFLFLSEGSSIVNVRRGKWQVRGNMIIPDGYELVISAGTTLQFEEGGSLIIYGTTRFRGTAASPIVLEGQPIDVNAEGVWQGLAVYYAPDRSQWSHVTVRNTTGVSWPLWKLTGGVTFYQSDIDMNHCVFFGNKGEDALNIIHSDFELNDVDILKTASDGFDGDFTTGTISGGLYQDIGMLGGGDGVDVSGSKVTIDGIQFTRIGDKAISVGESSTLTAINVVADGCGVGAASKDNSILNISDSTIKNAHNVALMAYTKKPEFGPAKLVARNTIILDSKESVLVQQGSYLEFDGKPIDAKELDVKNLYQTIMKPGLSK